MLDPCHDAESGGRLGRKPGEVAYVIICGLGCLYQWEYTSTPVLWALPLLMIP